MIGLPEVAWNKEENKKEGDDKPYLRGSGIQDPNQSTISEFMT